MERLRITRLSCNRLVLISFCFDRCKGDSIVCTSPPPFAGGGGGIEPPTNFSKRKGRLDRTSVFRGGLQGKRGVTFFRGGCNFWTK